MSPAGENTMATLHGDFIFRFRDEQRQATIIIRTTKLRYKDSNSSLTKELIKDEKKNACKMIDSFWRTYAQAFD